MTTPFSFAKPEYLSEELEPWSEQSQTWRRIKVSFPTRIAMHSAEQVFYFDSDGCCAVTTTSQRSSVQGRLRIRPHYTSDYQEFDGIMVPTRRLVYPVDPDGNVSKKPFIITIDLDSMKFSWPKYRNPFRHVTRKQTENNEYSADSTADGHRSV